MLDPLQQLDEILPSGLMGSVVRTQGATAAVADFPAPIGAVVELERTTGSPLRAEVIGFRDDLTLVYAWDDMTGVRRGNRVHLVRTARWLRAGDELLGRVVNAQGQAIDGRPQPVLTDRVPLDAPPLAPFARPRIDTSLGTGIRAIDSMLTCGRGQRIGIFAGSGVGKSVLLGMMAQGTSADVNVIGLVGERGREVNEFVERNLGPQGLAKSVVVVATSDEPALARVRAAFTATAMAEYFRQRGRNVLLVVDSLTRVALAQREIALAAGEPAATRGFAPSVFSLLPKLLERAGRTREGSITGIYSVLVEADDPQEPISDALRSLLDGHVWLSRKLAARGHYPAIDVLESISRLMTDVTSTEHQASAQAVRGLLAARRDHEDLIAVGAYRPGTNRTVDLALALESEIDGLLRQPLGETISLAAAQARLAQLAQQIRVVPEAASRAA